MTQLPLNSSSAPPEGIDTAIPAVGGATDSAPGEPWVNQLGILLGQLDGGALVAGRSDLSAVAATPDNELVEVRLGMASSLFAALQCKHAGTAGHSLRVALTCSAWALRRGLPPPQRDAIEVAALLHDIGLIGAPDAVLLKPGKLDADEQEVVAQARRLSLDILRHSCASREVLDIVEAVPRWYDGTRPSRAEPGQPIPLGARMIAIAEAFDAMTTDHVYRPAMSQERAMAELFAFAGTQFDPELVRQFAELQANDQSALREEVARRWLHALDPELVNSYWQLNCVPSPDNRPDDRLFQAKLLENMYDAVVFVDAGLRVTMWNRGAERLTGIASTSIRGRQWQPDLLSVCDERGQPLAAADCPVESALRTGVQSLRRLTIWGRTGRAVAVDAHAIPVIAPDGVVRGAILLMHDASSETSLEQRCQSLYEKATRDPLTQVANRAEFDRVHAMFVAAHQQQQVPCALMICDLDRFKQVNDTYGHQAGDDVIRSLAALLKSSCRPGDLVARYGGEEFVVLCADCDNATAARRAEQIRLALGQIPQPKMDGRTVTVSFGVTEIQPGDTPETMLRRADRALLMAKDQGRNRVVQLGSGLLAEPSSRAAAAPRGWPSDSIEQTLVTTVPVKMAVEKLRGFVADHQAKIVAIDGDRVRIELDDRHPGRLRRLTDRPVTFALDLKLEELRSRGRGGPGDAGPTRTRVHLVIQPRKHRDRRRNDVMARAREVLVSFRSYLMATEEEPSHAGGSRLSRARRILTPWRLWRSEPS